MSTAEQGHGTSEPAATSPPVKASANAAWKKPALLLIVLSVIIWVAMVGVYSIEELNSRQETLRVLISEEERASAELALTRADKSQAAAAVERLETIGRLRRQLVALIVSGAVSESGGFLTVRTIQCELVQLRRTKTPAKPPEMAPEAVSSPVLELEGQGSAAAAHSKEPCAPESQNLEGDKTLRKWVLASSAASNSSGLILALTIITAAFGGALIMSSLPKRETADVVRRALPALQPDEGYSREDAIPAAALVRVKWRDDLVHVLRALLRAMSGGVVCYLAINGGAISTTAADLSKALNPATAVLYGLLAGMFSEEVLKFLARIVKAFFERLAPEGFGSGGGGPRAEPSASSGVQHTPPRNAP
jgi:hypothetical protein